MRTHLKMMYKPFVKANGLNFCGTVRAFAFDDQPGCPVEIVYADYCIQVIVPTHSVNSLLAIGKQQDIANERYTSIFNETCPTQGERRRLLIPVSELRKNADQALCGIPKEDEHTCVQKYTDNQKDLHWHL